MEATHELTDREFNPAHIDKLAAALAKAQGEMTNPPKTKRANLGKYTYSYADLAEIIEHVRPILSKHGLAYTQLVLTERDAPPILRTVLMHESGQSIAATYLLPRGVAAQEMGSAITYARRYSLCSILGISAEDDDDGAKADGAKGTKDASRDQLIELMGTASVGNRDLVAYLTAHGMQAGKSADDLDDDTVQRLVDHWGEVTEWIKDARKPVQPPAKPKQTPPPPDKPEPPAASDTDGMDERLVALMTKSGITADQIKAYYTERGHVPAGTEPANLPKAYVDKLIDNWERALLNIKTTK